MGAYIGSDQQKQSPSYPDRDVICTLTNNLVSNILVNNPEAEKRDYGILLETIRERGSRGKDRRYVIKQLLEAKMIAEKDGLERAVEIFSKYLNLVPDSPYRTGRRRRIWS